MVFVNQTVKTCSYFLTTNYHSSRAANLSGASLARADLTNSILRDASLAGLVGYLLIHISPIKLNSTGQ